MTRSDPTIDYALRALRLLPRFHRWAAASVQANHLGGELSLRQLTVLYSIRDGISSPGQLARRMLVTPAVITGLLDRLERRGYVRRETEPDDRRRLRMVLTESGLAVGQEVRQALAQQMAAQFASASSSELKELGRALDLLERSLGALEKLTPTAPASGPEDEAEWDLASEEQRPASPRARSSRKANGGRAPKTSNRRRGTPVKSGRK
ncbi:MarR family winged helix-turn-helix transcriptional regulator [Vitiosangium sp. GDMCC 1.1324]|uniref:MarR family winged helix-turn-helix transcriptional regulator n=1 Tax=Vitiosangium sp. (strain GDMCC 1.1324) TaxID=2138576 RepID=UPI000D3354BF|nr:MarR family transcriptional regulator [Vitiosangium sp. GDMCC 1.1324]PTL84882.1 MarR family transcriptional regulator [Vitiosangium sp. GDMCC 1.1324]